MNIDKSLVSSLFKLLSGVFVLVYGTDDCYDFLFSRKGNRSAYLCSIFLASFDNLSCGCINCLMLDIPYRLSVATQNVGYNQPPEPGFYLGPDRTDYLR